MQGKLNDDRPIWVQLTEQLTEQIVSGGYLPGARVPPVRELAGEAGVNPNTMQRALAQLEADGLVITNRTAGRTVTEDGAAIAAVRGRLAEQKVDQYLDGMETLGYSQQEAARLAGERRRMPHE